MSTRPVTASPLVRPGATRPAIVTVPLDGTAGSRAALPVARMLAQIEDAALNVLYVGSETMAPGDVLPELNLHPGEVDTFIVDSRAGAADVEILRHAAESHATAIVMSAYTGAGRSAGPLGSVARAVVEAGTSPVVLVSPTRGDRPWLLQQILFPHDGVRAPVAALRRVAALADRARAELAILHVASAGSPEAAALPGALSAPRYVDQPQHEWPAWALEFVQRVIAVGEIPASVRMRLFFACGDAASAVTEHLENYETDLLVVPGFPGRDPQQVAVIEQLIMRAPCPVMVDPASDASDLGGHFSELRNRMTDS